MVMCYALVNIFKGKKLYLREFEVLYDQVHEGFRRGREASPSQKKLSMLL